MPTVIEVTTALRSLKPKVARGDFFSTVDVANELGMTDPAIAIQIARIMGTLPQVKSAGIGAHVIPNGIWTFT